MSDLGKDLLQRGIASAEFPQGPTLLHRKIVQGFAQINFRMNDKTTP